MARRIRSSVVSTTPPVPTPLVHPALRRMQARPFRRKTGIILPNLKEGKAARDSTGTTPTLLSSYFHDVSVLSPFSAEQEQEMSQHLQHKEQEIWRQFLLLSNSCEPLQKWFSHLSATKRMSWPITSERVMSWARRLHKEDTDRIWVETAFQLVRSFFLENLPPVNTRENWYQIQQARREISLVKHTFAQANLRLVITLARRMQQSVMPLPDLIQEGNIGLLKAIDRFDAQRGYRFSTYAAWWIRHAMSRAIADKGRSVRVPVHMQDTYQRLLKSRRALTQQLGRSPSLEELSKDTQIPLQKIHKMHGYLLEVAVSMDQSLSAEDGRSLVDMIEDDSPQAKPLEQLFDKSIHTATEALLRTLSPLETTILEQRFGLTTDDDEERTLKEIGKQHRLSRERIRQIQERALQKIRQGLVNQGLLEDFQKKYSSKEG